MNWRVVTLVALLWVVANADAGSLSWVTQDRWVTVQRVIDGDTFVTRKGERVRLLGINAPEIQHDASPAEPYGDAAHQALRGLISGQQVRLSFDQEKKDKYGRTLAHVYLRDGRWVNAEMLSLGSAFVYTFSPNVKQANALMAFEQAAEQQRIGLWQDKRWQVLSPDDLSPAMLGQFRLIRGSVSRKGTKRWVFFMGKLAVSIPKQFAHNFAGMHRVEKEDRVLLRGKLRMTKQGQWFVSVHTKSDIYHYR